MSWLSALYRIKIEPLQGPAPYCCSSTRFRPDATHIEACKASAVIAYITFFQPESALFDPLRGRAPLLLSGPTGFQPWLWLFDRFAVRTLSIWDRQEKYVQIAAWYHCQPGGR
jgi:hypothetical protein